MVTGMPDGSATLTLTLHAAIAEIPASRLGCVRRAATIRSSATPS